MRLTGIIPGLIFHIFFGVLGLFTGIMLVKFKLNHPEVHTMGNLDHASPCGCILTSFR